MSRYLLIPVSEGEAKTILIPDGLISDDIYKDLEQHVINKNRLKWLLRQLALRGVGGGGGWDNGYFFVKLDFEIAVDQQTRTSDRTFEGVPDPNRQTVPAGQPRPYFGPN